MGKNVPMWAAICLVLITTISTASIVWTLTSLKVIRGTAFVEYRGDIRVEDFKFASDEEVSITISTNLSPTPACAITISGAGISGSKTVSAGWSSPYTVLIPFTGTLSEGTMIIEITA